MKLNLASKVALGIPALRRLRDYRNLLQTERDALLTEQASLLVERDLLLQVVADEKVQVATLKASAGSPFVHYHSSFDPDTVIRRHAVRNLKPHPDYYTNYLGVLIDPKYFPDILKGREGTVECLPIPANWHADMAEWGAAQRAVDLARGRFTVIELGCGWGCWINNTGVAARRVGLEVSLIGVEGDQGHITFAHEAALANGFQRSQVSLHYGIATASSGTALFPRQLQAGGSWGLEPVFGATDLMREEALQAGTHDALTMITLDELAAHEPRVDLLHVDIQGGEADLIAGSLRVLHNKVAYLLIGTHSRSIEGKLFETLQAEGWQLEIERPALLSVGSSGVVLTVDGVQGWRNPMLLPE